MNPIQHLVYGVLKILGQVHEPVPIGRLGDATGRLGGPPTVYDMGLKADPLPQVTLPPPDHTARIAAAANYMVKDAIINRGESIDWPAGVTVHPKRQSMSRREVMDAWQDQEMRTPTDTSTD